MIIIDILQKSIRWQQQKNIDAFLVKTTKKILPQTSLASFLQKKSNSLQLNIILLADSQIKKINQQFRQQNKPTNVLSFASLNEIELQTTNINQVLGNSNFVALGDLLFAYQTIEKEAKQQNKTFHNHLTHLLIHGILHLLGNDHQQPAMAKIMEEQEIAILQNLNITNPYL